MARFPSAALMIGLIAGLALVSGGPAAAQVPHYGDVTIDVYFDGNNSPYSGVGDVSLTINQGLADDNLQLIGYELRSPSTSFFTDPSLSSGVTGYNPAWQILVGNQGNLQIINGTPIGAPPGTLFSEGASPVPGQPLAGAIPFNAGMGDSFGNDSGGNTFPIGYGILDTSKLVHPSAPTAADLIFNWIGVDSLGQSHTFNGGEIVFHDAPPPENNVPEPSTFVMLFGAVAFGCVTYIRRRHHD